MLKQDRKFVLSFNEYVKIVKLIENLRVSLDHIGAISNQGIDKMHLATDEYLNDHEHYKIYKQIKDAAMILLPMVNDDEWEEISKDIKYSPLKKYD